MYYFACYVISDNDILIKHVELANKNLSNYTHCLQFADTSYLGCKLFVWTKVHKCIHYMIYFGIVLNISFHVIVLQTLHSKFLVSLKYWCIDDCTCKSFSLHEVKLTFLK